MKTEPVEEPNNLDTKSPKQNPGGLKKAKMALGHLDIKAEEISGKRMKDDKKALTVRLLKHQDRLPTETVECPSLEILKAQLDTVLCNLLRPHGGGIELQRSPWTLNSVWFCNKLFW